MMASDARVSGVYRLKEENIQIMFGSLVASVFPDSFHFTRATFKNNARIKHVQFMFGAVLCDFIKYVEKMMNKTAKSSECVIASRNDF